MFIKQVNQHAVMFGPLPANQQNNTHKSYFTVPAGNIALVQEGYEWSTYLEFSAQIGDAIFHYALASHAVTGLWHLQVWNSLERCASTEPTDERILTEDSMRQSLANIFSVAKINPNPGKVFEEVFAGHSPYKCDGARHPYRVTT